MEDLTVNSEIDTKGTKCPMPMLKTKKALAKMLSGEVLRILATDPHAEIDLKQFAQQTGHEFISSNLEDGVYVILMRRK
ncbi:hypothetical protein A4V04_04980 [Burkholderiales bacterium YL45]|uniref:UPF0033 domain-containing protein n=2 Tax=Turicimonas muris TaxID=1796652 RepID=A0A227KDT3_9BURK|nr:sulfurtransferase TusA family protein [Turicimonas muris]ANU65835.1 hypothetical protein A4V04_04980 [Burkholderiales bacterium YL45]MBS4769157.1 sulfurtransferase TusA family protein [Burkholderiales bacterium]OXE45768.1 hypothetical protein ADH67_10080 [Turicimonas muris]QQQ96993.1 sulfurtransferase TusA family protein [Turicimonas muris]